MLRTTNWNEETGIAYFDFIADPTTMETTRLEFPAESNIAVIDQINARYLVAQGYARDLDEDEAEAWNEAMADNEEEILSGASTRDLTEFSKTAKTVMQPTEPMADNGKLIVENKEKDEDEDGALNPEDMFEGIEDEDLRAKLTEVSGKTTPSNMKRENVIKKLVELGVTIESEEDEDTDTK